MQLLVALLSMEQLDIVLRYEINFHKNLPRLKTNTFLGKHPVQRPFNPGPPNFHRHAAWL